MKAVKSKYTKSSGTLLPKQFGGSGGLEVVSIRGLLDRSQYDQTGWCSGAPGTGYWTMTV